MNEILTKLCLELRPEILLRVALSLLAGLVLGIKHDKDIGIVNLRDTLLITLASCLVMIISDSLYVQSLAQSVGTISLPIAPSLLAAGAVMCLGFIGASALIYQSKHLINDTTAAATLWFAALIGLSFGAGVFGIGILATIVTFFILLLVPHIERLIKRDKVEETVSPLSSEPAVQVDIKKEVTKPIEVFTCYNLEKMTGDDDKPDALEQLARHLSINQIFPSDLKQKRSALKLKRIKSRRIIAYMF